MARIYTTRRSTRQWMFTTSNSTCYHTCYDQEKNNEYMLQDLHGLKHSMAVRNYTPLPSWQGA